MPSLVVTSQIHHRDTESQRSSPYWSSLCLGDSVVDFGFLLQSRRKNIQGRYTRTKRSSFAEVCVRGLEAKRVLITGGASGIGAATAARFLDEGSVVCVLDRDADARHRIMHELPDLAGALDADVSEPEAGASPPSPRPIQSDGRRGRSDQQRRHQHPPQLSRHHAARVGQSHRRQSDRRLLCRADRGAAHDGTRRRRDSSNGFHQRSGRVSLTMPTTTRPRPE